MRLLARVLTAIGVGGCTVAGCASHFARIAHEDFEEPATPGCCGRPDPRAPFRVVSFNIKFARNVAGAVHLFATRPELGNPDVIMLQEMDHRGTRDVARAFGLYYAYFPAARHPQKIDLTLRSRTTPNGCEALANGHARAECEVRADPELGYFGAALLSPWPLEDPQKILLERRGRDEARKVAVAATVVTPRGKIRAVSVHLPTHLKSAFREELEDVFRCVLEGRCPGATLPLGPDRWSDAPAPGSVPGNFVLAGDFNSDEPDQLAGIEEVARSFGAREAPGIRSTFNLGFLRLLPSRLSFDHVIYGPSFDVVPGQSGTVDTPRSVSDHRAAWAVLSFRNAAPTSTDCAVGHQ